MVQGRREQEVHGGLGVQGVAGPWRRLQPTAKQRGGAKGVVNAAGTSSKVGEVGFGRRLQGSNHHGDGEELGSPRALQAAGGGDARARWLLVAVEEAEDGARLGGGDVLKLLLVALVVAGDGH